MHEKLPDCNSCEHGFTDDEVAGGWHLGETACPDSAMGYGAGSQAPSRAQESRVDKVRITDVVIVYII